MGEALDSLFGPDVASHLRENLISSLETNKLGEGTLVPGRGHAARLLARAELAGRRGPRRGRHL